MDTRDYTANASTIATLVSARHALRDAFDKLSAALGMPTTDETVVPGNPKSTAAALRSAQQTSQHAAGLLASLGADRSDTPGIDAMLGGVS